MQELRVVGVRVELPGNQPILLLKEAHGERYLPIWIGAVEATAIAFAQQGVVPPRPLTHDLLRDVLEATGNEVAEIRITEMKDDIFYAMLVLASGVEVSARPSDSIALALRTGSRIVCAEELLENAGILVPDALIETWQPDPDGRFPDLHGYGGPSELTGFRGFARSGFEEGDGHYEIVTVKPGAVPTPDDRMQAPHIDVSVFARGMLNRVVTRVYFPDEAVANSVDPVLLSVPAERRSTLVAVPAGEGLLRFDVRLQGAGETVFFDL